VADARVGIRCQRRLWLVGDGFSATAALAYAARVLGVTGVVSVSGHRKSSRDRIPWEPLLGKRAAALGIRHLDQDQFERCQLSSHDVVVMIGYDTIVSKERLREARFINFHSGLLPTYRGARTNVWPILNGELRAGVTCHVVDAALDAGPIIATREFDLQPDETARSLYRRLAAASALLFRSQFGRLLTGTYSTHSQDISAAKMYRKNSIDFRVTEIDFTRSASFVNRFVRAMFFPEFQTATVAGRPVYEARVSTRLSTAQPGTQLTDVVDGWLRFATSDFDVDLRIVDRTRALAAPGG